MTIKGMPVIPVLISMLLNAAILWLPVRSFFRSTGAIPAKVETARPFMVFSEPVYETSSALGNSTPVALNVAAVFDGEIGGFSTENVFSEDSLSRRIKALIDQNLHYPPLARRRGVEGTVRLVLAISEDGELQGIQLQESSGSLLLDNAALDLSRSIFPLGVRLSSSMELAINIQYRLEDA
jgi:protein TonB